MEDNHVQEIDFTWINLDSVSRTWKCGICDRQRRQDTQSGCALGGKTYPSGTTIHLKDRWGTVLRSWQCFGGKWVPVLQA